MFTMSLDNKSRIQTICNHANSKINPIFELVLIEAKNDEVTFSASNGAQYNSLTLPAQVTVVNRGHEAVFDCSHLNSHQSVMLENRQ